MGLYAVPVALVAYAIFGSSRRLIVGPASTVSVLSGSSGRPNGAAATVDIDFGTVRGVWMLTTVER